eukprot:scaffold11042_cov137-Isochrysis_galbana.AAC.6
MHRAKHPRLARPSRGAASARAGCVPLRRRLGGEGALHIRPVALQREAALEQRVGPPAVRLLAQQHEQRRLVVQASDAQVAHKGLRGERAPAPDARRASGEQALDQRETPLMYTQQHHARVGAQVVRRRDEHMPRVPSERQPHVSLLVLVQWEAEPRICDEDVPTRSAPRAAAAGAAPACSTRRHSRGRPVRQTNGAASRAHRRTRPCWPEPARPKRRPASCCTARLGAKTGPSPAGPTRPRIDRTNGRSARACTAGRTCPIAPECRRQVPSDRGGSGSGRQGAKGRSRLLEARGAGVRRDIDALLCGRDWPTGGRQWQRGRNALHPQLQPAQEPAAEGQQPGADSDQAPHTWSVSRLLLGTSTEFAVTEYFHL